MAQISVLDQNTINKIAAGEVVERPASVVKELVENAIDAGANMVTVEIRDGGLSFIRVTDNGCGIEKEQIAVAFLRHATSKIKTAEDLFSVTSLGFRGEALSSIASVSQVELITKVSSSVTGVSYCIEGGKEKSMQDIGTPNGTTFIVKNLFYNTPARRKFLKSATTEGTYISELMERIALSHPEVSVRFIQNGQNKLHTTGNNNLKDIIYTIYGREIAANLIQIDLSDEKFKIEGFIGKPVIARGNRNFENYYINGRYIKSKIIAKAIEDAYKPFMMLHRYPFVVLHLSIPTENIDVNVHPTKMEIRFKSEENLYKRIYTLLSESLSQKEFIPEVHWVEAEAKKQKLRRDSTRMPEPFEQKRSAVEMIKELGSYGDRNNRQHLQNRWEDLLKKDKSQQNVNSKESVTLFEREDLENKPDSQEEAGLQSNINSQVNFQREKIFRKNNNDNLRDDEVAQKQEKPDVELLNQRNNDISGQNLGKQAHRDNDISELNSKNSEQLDLFDGKLLDKSAKKSHRIIGQLFDTYWLIQFEDKLFIIDQHAAHEKVLFERMIRSFREKQMTSQQITPPIVLTLNSREKIILDKYKKYFLEYGYEMEPFGGKEYAITAVPANLYGLEGKAFFLELLDSLNSDIEAMSEDMIMEKVASMSCKAAVKGNHKLSFREVESLIDELMKLDNPYACPHGRPIIISMSKYELEKKFKRQL